MAETIEPGVSAAAAGDAAYRMLLDELVRARSQAEYLRGITPANASAALERYIAVKDEQILLLSRYLGVPLPRSQPAYVPSVRALVVNEIRTLERIYNAYEEAELPTARLMLNQLLRQQVRALVALISLL